MPVTATDVIAPGDNYAAKISAMMSRAAAAVIDASTQNTLLELGMLTATGPPIPIMVVVERNSPVPFDIAEVNVVHRTSPPFAEQPKFLTVLDGWFRTVANKLEPRLAEEPLRLLKAREYRAAVISAMTYVETILRDKVDAERVRSRAYTFTLLIDLAAERGVLFPDEVRQLREWSRVRNATVHSQAEVPRGKAVEIVNGAMKIAQRLRAAG